MLERELKARYKRNPLKHAFAEGLVLAFVDLMIQGEENLDSIWQLIERKIPVEIFPNHLSHADGPIIDHAMRRLGYKDLAKKLNFVLGTVLINNPFTRQLITGYNYIPVPSRRKTATDKQQEGERRGMTDRCHATCGEVMDKGEIPVIFAEGTRRREGKMARKVHFGNSRYLHLRPNVHVVPIAVWGGENILPPNMPLPRPGFATISIGRPIAVADLEARIDWSSGARRDQMLIDEVMSEVAALLPQKYRGVYNRETQPVQV